MGSEMVSDINLRQFKKLSHSCPPGQTWWPLQAAGAEIPIKKKACPEKGWPLLTYEKHQFQISYNG
jgi:hypothetical protein